MKYLFSLFIACLITTVSFAQTTQRNLQLANFNKIEAGSAFSIQIKQGKQFSVVASGDASELDNVIGSVTNNTLQVYLKNNTRILKGRIQLTIQLPTLVQLDLTGATKTELVGFDNEDNLSINLSGASSLEGNLKVDNLYLDVSGASKVTLTGKADKIEANTTGASRFNGKDFKTKDATLSSSGAGSITLAVSDHLKANANGAGKIRYIGSPKVSEKIASGAGSIKQE